MPSKTNDGADKTTALKGQEGEEYTLKIYRANWNLEKAEDKVLEYMRKVLYACQLALKHDYMLADEQAIWCRWAYLYSLGFSLLSL